MSAFGVKQTWLENTATSASDPEQIWRRACNPRILSQAECRQTCKLLSQSPRLNEAEGVFAAGKLAIGREVVLFERRSLATSSADTRARSQRK
jgi:hypothetical protein